MIERTRDVGSQHGDHLIDPADIRIPIVSGAPSIVFEVGWRGPQVPPGQLVHYAVPDRLRSLSSFFNL